MKKKKEIDRIAMGTLELYITEWEGTSVDDIPSNEVLETEDNRIGRTKDGGTVTYKPTFYTAKSDDGKAVLIALTEEEVNVSVGLITLNGDKLSKIVSTSRVTVEDGVRTTKIGGIDNFDGKLYLFRAVHKGHKNGKGDIRYTFIGLNTEGFAEAYKPNQEVIVTPAITTAPFDDGTLLIRAEYDIDTDEVVSTQSISAKTTAKTNTAS